MIDRLQIVPAELRRTSAEERRRADWLAEQAKGKALREWHANFIPTYGKSALAPYNALDGYIDERERAFNALADQHRYIADTLDAFANDMERADEGGGPDIANVANGFGPGHTGPSGPGSSGPSGPLSSRPGAPGADDAGPSQPAARTGSDGTEFAGAPAAGVAGSMAGVDGPPRTPGPSPHAETTPAPGQQPPPGGPTTGAGPSGGGPGSGVVVPPTAPPGATPPAAGTPGGQDSGEPVTPVPVVPAAAQSGKQRATQPSQVEESDANEDLVLARTLLAAILEAVEAGGARQSTIGLDWSVSVMRGPSGAYAFVTTSEGRWLPAGLFLPEQVAVPWLAEIADHAPAWEEITDPARVLVEFAGVWGESSGTQLTALVSSTDIDRSLRAQLDKSVGVEANVSPAASDLDLALPGPGLLDRLTTLGDDIDEVPRDLVMAQCVRLAAEAHAQVVRRVGVGLEVAVREVAVARGLREQIQAALQTGHDVPEQLWQGLWDADVAIAAALTERRARLGRDGVVDQLLLERRCNELVLLLADGASQQTMRDVTYSNVQVLGHPVFDQAPVAAEARGDRPVVAAPTGAGAPPATPPAASPWASSVNGRVG